MDPKELRYARRHAAILVVAAALALSLLALPALGLGWQGALLTFAAAAVVLAVPAVLFLWLLARVVESDRQQRALIAVRPLLGTVPAPLGPWAIDPHLAELLVHTIERERPRLIVECGSGASTVVMAACLRELGGDARIISVDHEERFAEGTRRLLRERGLERWAEVWTAPLEERGVAGRTVLWYGPFEDRLPGPVDLLFVDGPPKLTAHQARRPAVPALAPRLAPGCLIVLDDGYRRGERATARAWARELGGSLEFVRGGRGVWLVRNGG